MPPPSYTTSRTGTPEAGAVEIDTTPILAESRTINDQKQKGEKPGSTENICVKHKFGICVGVLLLVGVFLVQKGMTKTVTTTAVATEAVSTTTAITTKDAATVTTSVATEKTTSKDAASVVSAASTTTVATEKTTTVVSDTETTTTEDDVTAADTVAAAVEVCVPGSIMTDVMQLDYCGDKSVDEDNNPCWMWNKTSYWDKYPLFHNMLIKEDGQAHNYCRNPSESSEAWCVTGPEKCWLGICTHEYGKCGIKALKVA